MADPWNWKTVFETLLGTAVGAIFGGWAILWQLKLEKHERYETRITDKLSELNEFILATFRRRHHPIEAIQDDTLAISFQLGNIAMHANDDDQFLMGQLAACSDWEKHTEVRPFMEYLGWMMKTISEWRSEYISREETEKRVREKIVQLEVIYVPKAPRSTFKRMVLHLRLKRKNRPQPN